MIDRLVCPFDQTRCFAYLADVRLERRLVAGQVDGDRSLVPVDLGEQDVLRDVDVDRARAAGARQVEGFAQHARQVLAIAYEVVLLGDRDGDARDIGFLEGVGADHVVGYVGRDGHERDGVHVGVADPGDQVGGAGAAGAEAHADGALVLWFFQGGRGAGVAVGHVRGALLVANQDVMQLGKLGQDVVEGHDGATGQPKDGGRAFLHQRPTDCSCTRNAHQTSFSRYNKKPHLHTEARSS